MGGRYGCKIENSKPFLLNTNCRRQSHAPLESEINMLKSIIYRMPSGEPERKRSTKPGQQLPGVPERKRLSMKDVLLWADGEPPKPGPRRIGIHTSTAGGVEMAAERAYRL